MATQHSFHVRFVSIILIIALLAIPLLAQETSSSSLTPDRIASLKDQAEADAKAMDKTGGYFAGGFLCGIVGFIIAVSSSPDVPTEKLVELSDVEKEIYSDAYVKAAKSKRTTSACTGWAFGSLLTLLILSAGSGS